MPDGRLCDQKLGVCIDTIIWGRKFKNYCSDHGECPDGKLCDQQLNSCIDSLDWRKKFNNDAHGQKKNWGH